MRVVFAKDVKDTSEEKEEEDENVLPAFVKGESGPHVPDLNEKWTQPPRPYTEATLLRAMEQPESWWIMTNSVML